MRRIRTRARRVAGKMNGLETRYSLVLEARRRVGEIAWYGYEALTFKLAHDTRYTPDFCVVTSDGAVEAHECKGFWKDDALVKIKVAANLFPWVEFRSVQADGKGWKLRLFEPGELPRVTP